MAGCWALVRALHAVSHLLLVTTLEVSTVPPKQEQSPRRGRGWCLALPAVAQLHAWSGAGACWHRGAAPRLTVLSSCGKCT